MSKLSEHIKSHPYRYSTTGVVASLLLADLVGYAKNPTYDIPEASCASPWTISSTYVNPNASAFWNAHNTGLGPSGVLAQGNTAGEAYGIQASWKHPSDNTEKFDQQASQMLKADEIGNFAAKLAVGDGQVQFGIRVIAPDGSALCDQAPIVQYTHLDRSAYFTSGAQLPYPNVVNVLPTLFSGGSA